MKIKKYTLRLLFIFLTSLSGIVSADGKSRPAEWGYEGNIAPERWGQLHPSYEECGTGKQQSPINIKNIELDRRANIRFSYTPASVEIAGDAKEAAKLNPKYLTKSDNGSTVQLYFADAKEEAVILDGESYRLIETHFHKPGEHLIAGQRFPLEIHFVHENSKGQLLAVGVFIQTGKRENEGMTEILKALQDVPASKSGKAVMSRVVLSPMWMFPGKQSYYEYMGSLTTPPCGENVRWLVMAVPVEVSLEQVSRLEKLIKESNSRPIQSLNGREVKEFLSESL